MVASASTHRKGDHVGIENPAQKNCGGFTVDLCPDLIIAGLGAAMAAGFAILFTQITAAGRKKKRSAGNGGNLISFLEDLSWNLGTF